MPFSDLYRFNSKTKTDISTVSNIENNILKMSNVPIATP